MPSTALVNEALIRFEGFTIDAQRRGLYRGAERVHLTPTPFKVLAFLAQNRGRAVSKEELLDTVWGEHREGNTVEQAIRQVRRALGDETESARFIQTIPGEGYCFIAQIEEVTENAPAPERESQASNTQSAVGNRSKSRRVAGSIGVTFAAGLSAVLFATFALRQSSLSVTAENPTKITRSQTHILSPLLSDGVHIDYPRYDNGKFSVASVPIEGGESTDVVTGITNPELCDLAPGGEKLLRNLIHSRDVDEPLYFQPKGGTAQRVGDVLAYDAAWYPDAKRILFSSNGVVYASNLQGEDRRQLFSVPGNAYWFRWSPDGKRLRFTVIDRKSEETSIWEVAADGQGPHRLFPELHNQQCCGSWALNGKLFAFQVRVANAFQIWAQQDRSSQLIPLSKPPFPLVSGAISYRGPLSGPDGRKIFVRAEAQKGELVRYDAKLREFIPVLPSISARTFAYSHNRNWIAYTSLADNNLWRCRANGTECLQLTHEFKNTVMPSWSPDGQMIAFMGLGFTGKWRAFTIASNGGTIQPLPHDEEAKGYPDWSLDGHKIAFSDVPPVSLAKGIYIVDIDSRSVVTLPGSAGLFDPRWSPDGRFLLALHSGDLSIYLYELATGKWQPLAKVPAAYPNWSQDGKYIYFRSASADNNAIFRVAVDSHSVEKVANLAGVERGPFFMGDWIGLAPDDSPVAVRNSTIDDIYSWDLTVR